MFAVQMVSVACSTAIPQGLDPAVMSEGACPSGLALYEHERLAVDD